VNLSSLHLSYINQRLICRLPALSAYVFSADKAEVTRLFPFCRVASCGSQKSLIFPKLEL